MIIWKLVTCQRITSTKYLTSLGRPLSPRYGQVVLVSGYPVLTAVNWSQHWCSICVHCQFSCAPKLARKYEIKHLVKQLTGQQTATKWITSSQWVDRRARDMVMWYWSVAILFWQLSLTILWMSSTKDVDLPRHAWDTPPFLLIVSPTPPVQSVDAYVCTNINHKGLQGTIFAWFCPCS